MWDDEHDKRMMRNQMRAIVLLMALMFGYYYWFVPQNTPAPTPAQEIVTSDSIEGPRPGGAEPGQTESGAEDDSPTEWPFLPPAALEETPDDEISISDQDLVLTFTKVGARLKRASVRLGKEGADSVQLVPETNEHALLPLGLQFTDERLAAKLDTRRFEAEIDFSGKAVTFTLVLPQAAVIRKHFSLGVSPHVLEVRVDYENLGAESIVLGEDATPAYFLQWEPGVDTGDLDRGTHPGLIWRREGQNSTLDMPDLAKRGEEREPLIEWFGYKSKYFMVAFNPEFEESTGLATTTREGLSFGVAAPRFEAQPGVPQSNSFRVYMGPLELASLEAAWPGLDSALTFFTMFATMDWFAKSLLSLLHWFYEHTIPNYGVAIIFLTILVRTVLLPLTLKSMRSMKRMQALAPEMETLKEKHKDDQQEFSRAMMELYRERGVNPLGGCFPMLLQMPIFIALYRMLWNAFELRGAPFLWVSDLSRPDCLVHMPFMRQVPFLGVYLECLNLLPILMAVAMVINMKMMPTPAIQNPQQKMIMNIMPVIFSVFCYPLAAGLNLYVLTSTVLGMLQQSLIRASGPAEAPKPVKRESIRAKRRNIWAQAQEMKRQQKKDTRRQKAQEAREERQKRAQGAQKPPGGRNGQPTTTDKGKRKGRATQ